MEPIEGIASLPPPPAPRTRRSRKRTVAILLPIAMVLLIGGFFLGRSLWWSVRPAPDFPSLATTPDPGRRGTVAYIKPYPHDNCVFVVAASGGPPKEVGCVEGAATDLRWLPDGRLEGSRFERGPGMTVNRRWIADVRAGTIEDVPNSESPPMKDLPESVPGPHGEEVVATSARGRLTVTLRSDEGTRTLLSVDAPETYTLGQPAWSPDGTWFVVKDDLDRLLLVTTADPSQTSELVDGGWGQAATDADLLDGAE